MESGNNCQRVSPMLQGTRIRHIFSYDRDVCLLRLAVQFNPWQRGKEYWNNVQIDYNEAQQSSVSVRTVKDRVELLLTKFVKEQENPTKPSVEAEEETEKVTLLKTISGLVADSANTPCNVEIHVGPNEVSYIETSPSNSVNYPPIRTYSLAPSEKKFADSDREDAVEFASGAAPELANAGRRKRSKLAPEDEMLKAKMELELKHSTDRLRMEEQRQKHDLTLEEQRQQHNLMMEEKYLELKQERLKAKVEKDKRKAELRKRRDDITVQQLKVQEQMLAMLGTFINNKERLSQPS